VNPVPICPFDDYTIQVTLCSL